MRTALIVINVLLALWLLAAVAGRLTGGSGGEAGEFSVKKSGRKANPAIPSTAAPKSTPPPSLDSRMATIIDNSIFNSERCPNALFMRGRQSRIELTLVGTFEIGGIKGAIIRQKAGSANNRGGFMGGPPERWGGRNNSAAGQRIPIRMQSQRVPIRMQFTDGVWRNTGGIDAAAQQQPDLTLRQYVRVGETLGNGYTLEEVTRTGAVLTRGSDRMELELQDPSLGLVTTTAAPRPSPPNFFQQLQMMQQMQMRQNFQMMRMMERTLQQNQGTAGNRGGAPPPPSRPRR